MAAGDTATTVGLLANAANTGGAGHVVVLDAAGRIIASVRQATGAASSPADDSVDYGRWSIVTDVLEGRNDEYGDRWAQLVWTEGGPAIYSAAPVRDSTGVTVGVVLAGSSVATILPQLKSDALAEVSLYDVEGRPFGTTFGLTDEHLSSIVPSTPLSATDLFEGYRERRQLLGRDYDLLWGDLRLRNEIVGRYSVGLPVSDAAGTRTTALWQMTALFGGITLAVFLLGWHIASRITRPLGRLVDAAGALALGDLTARSGVEGDDEVGVLARTFDTMAERMQRQQMATIGALASAIDARDPYTAGHSVRVGNLSFELGRELGMRRSDLYQLQIGGFLHDIGKIGVRDSVLLKPGELTDEEWALIAQHPEIGLKILAPADLPAPVLEIVGRHHERLDGTGYPRQLSADELTVFPRIVAVADVYDALTTHRPYKRALTPPEALRLLRDQADRGTLDIQVVATLHRIARGWEDARRTERTMTFGTGGRQPELRAV